MAACRGQVDRRSASGRPSAAVRNHRFLRWHVLSAVRTGHLSGFARSLDTACGRGERHLPFAAAPRGRSPIMPPRSREHHRGIPAHQRRRRGHRPLDGRSPDHPVKSPQLTGPPNTARSRVICAQSTLTRRGRQRADPAFVRPCQITSRRLVKAIPPATRATVYPIMMTPPTHPAGASGNACPDMIMTV